MQNDEGDDVVAAMREIAQRALPQGVNSEDDFEMLVGAFSAETRTLSYLDQLASLTEPKKKLRKAIKRVAAFAERVRDTGLSHVLEVIFERSVSNHEDARNLHTFIEAVTTTFDGKVVFANLNYDTLLLAALLHVCQSDVTDMGHGFRKVRVTREREKRRKFLHYARRHPTFRSAVGCSFFTFMALSRSGPTRPKPSSRSWTVRSSNPMTSGTAFENRRRTSVRSWC